jgi:putative oxidoreductase
VVEFTGSVMLIIGALTPVVCSMMVFIMAGAAVFVHGVNGVFISNGGWELVGVIAAGAIAIAAAGPGRYSVDHFVRGRQAQHRRDIDRIQAALPHPAQPLAEPLVQSGYLPRRR